MYTRRPAYFTVKLQQRLRFIDVIVVLKRKEGGMMGKERKNGEEREREEREERTKEGQTRMS